jgi:hypothetical protein
MAGRDRFEGRVVDEDEDEERPRRRRACKLKNITDLEDYIDQILDNQEEILERIEAIEETEEEEADIVSEFLDPQQKKDLIESVVKPLVLQMSATLSKPGGLDAIIEAGVNKIKGAFLKGG